MLQQLIALLKESKDGLSLFEISRILKSQPSAVMSMVELLVRKGKLLEFGPDGKCCTTCSLEAECNLLAVRRKRYVLAGYSENIGGYQNG